MNNVDNVELARIQSRGFLVVVCMAVVLCTCMVFFRFASGNDVVTPALEHRINPNLASTESLMRLPGIGRLRAEAIVAYRQQFLQKNGKDGFAFQDCNDLDNIKGIGPATVNGICEWLKFE